MNKTIAIVEDEKDIAENLRDALEQQGYSVNLYHNRADAETAFNKQLPDLVIIDIELGSDREAGFDLCTSLRKQSDIIPLLFLTARDSELDEMLGFKLGANDYLTKDSSQRLLLVRIEALFKRIDAMSSAPDTAQTMEHGFACLDLDRMLFRWQGEDVDLTLTEFWIVHSLMKNPGHVKSKQQLMDAANIVVEEATINTYIKKIRKKIRMVDETANPIRSEHAQGYRWKE